MIQVQRPKVLLLAPPNFSRYFTAHCYPNLGICSLAAHVENADVSCLDLRLVADPLATVAELVRSLDPDVVGISAMSFQYDKALEIADVVKTEKPRAFTVLGGYHATTGYRHLAVDRRAPLFDFVARGEQELAFNQLVQAIASGDRGYDRIPGISHWRDGELVHNALPDNLDLARLKLPARHKRLNNHFIGWGERVDLIETSRGCTLPCTYCSITRMYGRSFREHDLDRVMEDVLIMRSQGVEKVFIVDDNITLNVPRMKELCRRLIAARVAMKWHVQSTVVGIASDEELVELMARAGFVQVFLGIESLTKDVLKYYKKGGAKHVTARAVGYLQKHGIRVLGGFIIGAPDDTRASLRDLTDQILEMDIDLPYLQILTPYPGTAQRQELIKHGLVTNPDDFTRYDGDHANVRTHALGAGELARIQQRMQARLYLDPRTRAGRQFYRGLLAPHVPRTLWHWLAELVHQVRPGEPGEPQRPLRALARLQSERAVRAPAAVDLDVPIPDRVRLPIVSEA
jgi:radical SAM superfamily enzyme YgiQ (UPF0313 family)